VNNLLPALKKAYPGRKIVIVTDNASYHMIPQLAVTSNPEGPLTLDSISLEALIALAKEKNAPPRVLKQSKLNLRYWLRDHGCLEDACEVAAAKAGMKLLQQPPSFSVFNAIERVWAWVKGNIDRHADVSRTFKILGEELRREFARHEFTSTDRSSAFADGARSHTTAGYNFSALARNTEAIYDAEFSAINKWRKGGEHRRARYDYVLKELGFKTKPRIAELNHNAVAMYPSPSAAAQKPYVSNVGSPVTPRALVRRRAVARKEVKLATPPNSLPISKTKSPPKKRRRSGRVNVKKKLTYD